MKVTISRKAHFNAAHRLYNPKWDDEQNKLIFGKCFNPNFHGHNYELIVSVKGEVDQETGLLTNFQRKKNRKIQIKNVGIIMFQGFSVM